MKNRFQSYDFKSVDEFLNYLPNNERQIVNYLRDIVFNCLPNCTEKLSYNVPFYKVNKNICFIWPASITWGNKVTYEGVRFGFTSGYLLSDELQYLDKGERKQVYWRDYKNINEIDSDILKAYLFEAAEIDRKWKRS